MPCISTQYWCLVLYVAVGIFDNVLSEIFWAKAILLVGPTVATAGLSLQVPVAFIISLLIGRLNLVEEPLTAVAMLAGAVVILLGFYDLNLEVSLFYLCYKRIKR